MPRLLGVEIPADKRIEASLTYIYGIGLSTAKRILEQTDIDPNLRAKDLTPQQINEIIHAITNNKIPIEGDLRREMQGNLKRLAGDQLLSRHSSSPRLARARSADIDQRAHAQRSAQDRRRDPQQGRQGRKSLIDTWLTQRKPPKQRRRSEAEEKAEAAHEAAQS